MTQYDINCERFFNFICDKKRAMQDACENVKRCLPGGVDAGDFAFNMLEDAMQDCIDLFLGLFDWDDGNENDGKTQPTKGPKEAERFKAVEMLITQLNEDLSSLRAESVDAVNDLVKRVEFHDRSIIGLQNSVDQLIDDLEGGKYGKTD